MLKSTVHFVNTLLYVLKFFRIIKGLPLRNITDSILKSCQIFLAVGNSLQKNVGSLDVIYLFIFETVA